MGESMEVVWPLGKIASKNQQLARRLETLEGKTICGLFDGVFHFDETGPLVKESLSRKYPSVKFVDWDKFGVFAGSKETILHNALLGKLKQYRCDAAISGRGC